MTTLAESSVSLFHAILNENNTDYFAVTVSLFIQLTQN